jgi:hypothetical protein
MKLVKIFVLLCGFLSVSFLSASEFTVASYNCGGLSERYDYLRAACMEKLMEQRLNAEPGHMQDSDRMQQLALKILFASKPKDKTSAQEEWERRGYQQLSEYLTRAPTVSGSPNAAWYDKANGMITSYRERPVVISDPEVNNELNRYLRSYPENEGADRAAALEYTLGTLAKQIFTYYVNQDIICLQEADYLKNDFFPKHYVTAFSDSEHSKNGVVWNTKRFELVKKIGDIVGRAFAVMLRDKETGKTVLIASGHISGCDPYRQQKDPTTGRLDSDKGDGEIQTVVNLFAKQKADFKILALDSNVTALHPRLQILKKAGYHLDCEHHLEPTCTSPYQVLNNRIDWILCQSKIQSSIVNLPLQDVPLNSMHSNLSDHKPIAAKIYY